MQPNDNVIIDFEGVDHEGHVEKIEHGWCRAKILLDPELDYGTSSSRLSPHQTVCVPLSRVRPRA